MLKTPADAGHWIPCAEVLMHRAMLVNNMDAAFCWNKEQMEVFKNHVMTFDNS